MSCQGRTKAQLRIGTRGSQLALWQASHISSLLQKQGIPTAVEVIRTTGDRLQNRPFAQVGTKGMFTLELEQALESGAIDLAVHSLKDLPTELPEGFVLGAIPQRVDARDAFISNAYTSFHNLPAGARVGTSSVRRRAQLRALRPDLEYVEFRGNVDTRLRKLDEGQVEAVLLASAGLSRLGLAKRICQYFEPQELCPAAGQGALALEVRAGDEATLDLLRFLDHEPSRFAVTAERTALASLGGGCQLPIGVYCHSNGPSYTIHGAVPVDPEPSVEGAAGHPVLESQPLPILRATMQGSDASKLGHDLAESLKARLSAVSPLSTNLHDR